MRYVFADFELDAERAELRREGQPVRIEPQVFDLLRLLVSSSNRLVTREEIFEEIWADRIVSDAALSSRIRDARKALGDDGSTQKFIQTVQRRGLRFVVDVQAQTPQTGGVASAAPAPAAPPDRGPKPGDPFDRPAVAVLPFEDVSGPAPDLAFSMALTDELIAALSAWRYFPVVSRQSSLQLRGADLNAAEIGQRLKARYLVQGTFRRTGDRIKLQIAVTDTERDEQVWGDRFICDLAELQDVEEEVAAQIATRCVPEIQAVEGRRVGPKAPADMTAWELTIRAASLLSAGRRKTYPEALRLAEMAIERAPDYIVPYSLAATALFQIAMTDFSANDSRKAFAQTLKAARRALSVDQSAWLAHALVAVGELWCNRNHEKALLHVARAIDLNPSAAINYHFGGCINGFAGDPAKARFYQERLFRVDPTYPYRAVIEADLGLWHLLDEDFTAAGERLDRAEAWDPSYGRALQRRIALSGLIGDRDTAILAAKRLSEMGLSLNREVIVSSYPFQREEHGALFMEGLQRAGVNL